MRFTLAWGLYGAAVIFERLQIVIWDCLDFTQRSFNNIHEALIRASYNVQGTGKGPFV